MNEIKARYFAAMAAEIERYGGKVEKNIGDAIMAVFGRVRAREDDAIRGVQAAASMVDTLHVLNEEFAKFYGVQLTVRTGVNTGEVVANTDEHATMNLATGDAVNVAARLEQNAPANEVLIGEVTYALVRDYVEAERVELTLKGKAEPVPAYLLNGVHATTAVTAHQDSPFIGREFEMDILSGAFAEVGRAARGPDRHGHRRRRRREVPADRRLHPAQGERGVDPPRSVPRLRRRHHVLAADRDRAPGREDRGGRPARCRPDEDQRPDRGRRGS